MNAPDNATEIERLIPHRPPMRLIDAILSRQSDRIVCTKTFSDDEFFVQGHFPGLPVVPGVIQCECCLQAGAILLAGQTEAQESTESIDSDAPGADGNRTVPVATRMDGVKFKRIVRPGDAVEIEVTLNDQVSNAFYMTGKMRMDGKLVMRLDFACSISKISTEATP